MTVKRNSKAEYKALKLDISNNSLGRLYVLRGREEYLREYYLREMKKLVLKDGLEEFNYKKLDGDKLSMDELYAAVDALPVFSERTFVEVRDFDLSFPGEEQQARLIDLLSDIPEYCCLVFVYDTLEFKVGGASKVSAALKKFGSIVEFSEQDQSDLFNWIGRRFAAAGHEIGVKEKEHLILTCGLLMAGLIPEIEKISGFAKGKRITIEDIDAAAVPIPEAYIFKMTDAISAKNYDRAAGILGELLQIKESPVKILAVIGSQLRKLYTAKAVLDANESQSRLIEIADIKYEFIAKRLLSSAKSFSTEWCRKAVKLCAAYDFEMKSPGRDDEDLLKQLLIELAVC